jgi:RNA repair, ligase-Pnkp-associating, region of Hen1
MPGTSYRLRACVNRLLQEHERQFPRAGPMYLKIAANGPQAEQIGELLGRLPEKLIIQEPPNARLRVITEAAHPGSISFTLLAYPEPATGWEGSPAELEIVEYVKSRVVALSPLFRSFLDGAFSPALLPLTRHELVQRKFELQAEIAPLAVNFRNPHIRALFEPLGYRVEIESPIFGLPGILLRLLGKQTLTDVVRHLFVLVPALDTAKQAPLNPDEMRRLTMLSLPWLTSHPKRSLVARSYNLRLTQLLGAPAAAR